MTLPDGTPFLFPLAVDVRPGFVPVRLPDDFALDDLAAWRPAGGELVLDRPEQAAVGRPPELASLQEERYWRGPDELSAKVAVGCNGRGIFARAVVHDRNRGPLKQWPGVEGSCVEWYLDLRAPAAGLGSAPYGPDVAQIVAKPALAAGGAVELWFPGRPAPLPGVRAVGGVLDADTYWVGIFIPWPAATAAGPAPAFGFDVAVNGPPARGTPGRKSQLVLFGGPDNYHDASGFGTGTPAP